MIFKIKKKFTCKMPHSPFLKSFHHSVASYKTSIESTLGANSCSKPSAFSVKTKKPLILSVSLNQFRKITSSIGLVHKAHLGENKFK